MKPICLAGISKTKEHLRNILSLNEINQIKPNSRSRVAGSGSCYGGNQKPKGRIDD